MHNVCIIGCGGISEFHHNQFADTGRARTALVYDTDSEAAERRAREWGAEVMSSAAEMARDDVDIVVIATPGFARLDYVRMATEAGKAIMCEKPIALNLDDALAMKEMVDRSGAPFQVNFTQRYQPESAALHDVAASGAIGETVAAWARLDAPSSSERWLKIVESGHWRASMELSGGRINEFCSHSINWLLWTLGEPRSVYGKAFVVTPGFSLDDSDMAVIECEKGVGQLFVNRHAGVAKDRSYGVMGHGGSVALRDGKVLLTRMDQETEEVEVSDDVASGHERFLDCIERNERPLNHIDDAIATLRVCLAFNRSAETGRVEEV